MSDGNKMVGKGRWQLPLQTTWDIAVGECDYAKVNCIVHEIGMRYPDGHILYDYVMCQDMSSFSEDDVVKRSADIIRDVNLTSDGTYPGICLHDGSRPMSLLSTSKPYSTFDKCPSFIQSDITMFDKYCDTYGGDDEFADIPTVVSVKSYAADIQFDEYGEIVYSDFGYPCIYSSSLHPDSFTADDYDRHCHNFNTAYATEQEKAKKFAQLSQMASQCFVGKYTPVSDYGYVADTCDEDDDRYERCKNDTWWEDDGMGG